MLFIHLVTLLGKSLTKAPGMLFPPWYTKQVAAAAFNKHMAVSRSSTAQGRPSSPSPFLIRFSLTQNPLVLH